MSDTQRAVFWRLREEQPEGQRRLGAQLKHDLSVPPGQLVDFLDRANDVCREVLKGVTINAFGQLGDGNVHYNLTPAIGQGDFSGREPEFAKKLGRLATIMGGSFAAEHGLGRSKTVLADFLRGPVERSIMGSIKKALDVKVQLNPGVLEQ
jgi:FAD/FMN-containing dehydrogenase